MKYNADGASKENPGLSSYGFCFRNSEGDMVYAKAGGLRKNTNIIVEMGAIEETLLVCLNKNIRDIVLKQIPCFYTKL